MLLEGVLRDRTRTPAAGLCPIERAMGVVGSRNAMLIMREALYGTTRFDDFVRRVRMSEATAASNLRQLLDAGLLAKQAYRSDGDRTRHEYVLTEAGADLLPVLVALVNWGVKHSAGAAGIALTHADCDGRVDAVVRCEHGHDVDGAQINVRIGKPDRAGNNV